MATEKSALKELEHLLILEKEGSAQVWHCAAVFTFANTAAAEYYTS